MTAGMSSKGAAGRAKLQTELAQHKGVFFNSVIASMSRRMYPAQPVEQSLVALRDRGVTATQYLERYGGYGRTRDIGMITWQVGLIMDHLQEENWMAARDAVALLMVCLEQTAMDGGKMDIGLLLSLTEDPPQSMFSNRSLASGARPRAFAPLADQRWVMTALQYLKELDTIQSRRSEVSTTPKQTTPEAKSGSTQKKRKGKGRGKQAAAEEEQE